MTRETSEGEQSLPVITRRSALTATAGGLFSTLLSTTPATAQQDNRIQWTFETGSDVYSSPTVVDGTVFVGSDDDKLYAVAADTGEKKWTFETGVWVHASPTVVDGTVFVGDTRGNLYAVAADTGEQEWSFKAGDTSGSSPTVVDGTVFVGNNDSNLYAVAADTGEKKWTFETGDSVWSSPMVVDGTVFVGSDDDKLYAVAADTGEKKWTFETADAVESSPTVVNGTVFVGSNDGNLYAVAADTGEKKWTFETGDSVKSSPTVVGRTVFVGSNDDSLYAVAVDTGEQKWAFEAAGPFSDIYSSPTVVDGTVFVGSEDRNLYAVAADTGEQEWAFETADAVNSSPTVVDGTIFVGSNDGNLYAVNADVNGSSEGSRINLGTLGHHGDWRYAGQSIDIPEQSWVRDNATLIAGGVGSVAGGGYLIRRRRKSTGQSQEESSGSVSEALASGTAGTNDQSTTAREEPTADSESTSDRYPNTAERAIETAVAAESNNNYDEAAEAYSAAITEYQAALEDLAAGATEQRREIEQAIKSTRADLEAVEPKREAYQRAEAELQTIASTLTTGESALDDGDAEQALEQFEIASETLDTVSSSIQEHNFDGLADQVEELQKHCQSGQNRAEEILNSNPIPETIPSSESQSLRYAEINKGDSVGRGGNADVYHATTTTDIGTVELALKEPRMSGTLHNDEVERMLEEAETWQRLDDHDHIVSIIDYGNEPLPWIAMEYMDAGHLSERAGTLDIKQAVWTAIATTKAVRHAHRRGVAHLDLKPENVLFRSVEDAWDVPKVADWGLSKQLLEHSKSVEGMSPHYAAPEQFADKYGTADDITDVYQLGAVFYELFTGRPPFQGDTFEVVNQIQNNDPTPPSGFAEVPTEIDDILLTALATHKEDRYEDVLLLRNELQNLFDSL